MQTENKPPRGEERISNVSSGKPRQVSSARLSGGIRRSAGVSLLYAAFRAGIGIYRASAWLITSAVWFLLLGILRLLLARDYDRRTGRDAGYERHVYRRTAWCLFLLNLPMSAMILRLILTAPVVFYPGYTIYASAAYTFYMLVRAVTDLVRRRGEESPIVSAAGVLQLIAALMSVYTLQNALISVFSPVGDTWFRTRMNVLTGIGIFLAVIGTAVYMLLRAARETQGGNGHESLGE